MLNRLTKPYRRFIDAIITLFEERQYERKEKIIIALTKMMNDPSGQTKYKKKPYYNSVSDMPAQLSKESS